MSTFADELKELALTAPKEKDSEDVFNEESNAKLTEYEDPYAEVEKKRSAEILTAGRYKGKKISRREMFDDEDEDHFLRLNPNLYEVVDEHDDDDDDGDEEADTGTEQEVEEGDEGEGVADELDSQDDSVDGESIAEGAEEDETEGDDGEDYEDESTDDAENCDLSTFLKANEKFDQIEESVATRGIDAALGEELRKGRSIAHQMKVWDKLLEYRIQFQKVLALANQLPPSDVFKETMKDFLAIPENARIYKHCVRNIERAFEQLAAIREDLVLKYPEMQRSLEGKNPTDTNEEEIPSDEIPSDIASGYSEDDDVQPKPKRSKMDGAVQNGGRHFENSPKCDASKPRKFSLNEIARADEDFYQKLLPFRNATIDKWYQRTKLASGKTSKGYTALEQPPVKQIEHILEDQDRLLERTRIKRSQYKIIGCREPERKDSEPGKQVFAEIFDDDDFYHHLLREVIERKTQDISNPLEVSRHWIEIQKLRTKIKRKIDTKASKGRRIRYDVIPKLVSFMTPHDSSTFSDQAKDELFSSIFGRKTAVKPDTRLQLNGDDLNGFRLFK